MTAMPPEDLLATLNRLTTQARLLEQELSTLFTGTESVDILVHDAQQALNQVQVRLQAAAREIRSSS